MIADMTDDIWDEAVGVEPERNRQMPYDIRAGRLAEKDSTGGENGAGEKACPCARRGAPAPIQPADNAGAGAAYVNGHRDLKPHGDILCLMEQSSEAERKK